MTWTSPCWLTVATMAAASSSATARNSESLSRKWWKIAPRDSPVCSSSRRTVAPSYPYRAKQARAPARISRRLASNWSWLTLGTS
jgi:hypothetical protein